MPLTSEGGGTMLPVAVAERQHRNVSPINTLPKLGGRVRSGCNVKASSGPWIGARRDDAVGVDVEVGRGAG